MEFIEVLFSLAGKGKKSNSTVTSKIDDIHYFLKTIDKDLLDSKEAKLLETLIDSFDNSGGFPSLQFLKNEFGDYDYYKLNPADFKQYIRDDLKKREKDELDNKISEAIASSSDAPDLKSKLDSLLRKGSSSAGTIKKLGSFKEIYDNRALSGGLSSNITFLDQLTGGFQGGYVMSVAAWTSHGKSTFYNNMAYVNARKGKKVLIVSLEVPKDQTYLILLARHSFEVDNNYHLSVERILQDEMSDEEYNYAFSTVAEDFFKKGIHNNIVIIGREDLPKLSESGIVDLYREVDKLLGGLDMVIWDHVNTFKHIDPKDFYTGDYYIQVLTNIGKTYINTKGYKILTALAVQVNRQGWSRAEANGGEYDMLALAEFNEVERSSTYVLFLYSGEEMRASNELKVDLKKHRIGRIMENTHSTKMYPDVSYVGDSDSGNVSDQLSSLSSDDEDALNDLSMGDEDALDSDFEDNVKTKT